MAGVNRILDKVSAYSLVEVLTASVIIMVVLGISTSVFFSVIASSKSVQTIKAELILSELSCKVQKEQKLFDEEYDVGDFHIIKHVKPYQNLKDVFFLDMEIYNTENKLIGKRKELILNQ